jgi:hypothetical protein
MMLGARTSRPHSVRSPLNLFVPAGRNIYSSGDHQKNFADSFNEMRCYKYLAPTEPTIKPLSMFTATTSLARN